MSIKIKSIDVLDESLFDRIDFIEKACFDEDSAFPTSDIPDLVRESHVRVGGYKDGVLIGYGLARYACGIGYLYSNAVIADYRRKGVGSALLNFRLTELKKAGCSIVQAHTKLDNVESQALLRKTGFVPIQYVTDFYDDNVDAIFWTISI
jgi:ribosomal-protein-alanine N-acetyltransferase